MTKHKRQALLVGSMSFENEVDAVHQALAALGTDLCQARSARNQRNTLWATGRPGSEADGAE